MPEIQNFATEPREVVALPRELSLEQQTRLVTDYVRRNFVDEGMCATVAIHETEHQNPHAHILLITRTITAAGFGQKQRDWNQKTRLEGWRQDWARSANQALEHAGEPSRIDHRRLEAQGISRSAQIHLGKAATAMERKGIQTERGDLNRAVTGLVTLIEQGITRAKVFYQAQKRQREVQQQQALEGQTREREQQAQSEQRRLQQEQDFLARIEQQQGASNRSMENTVATLGYQMAERVRLGHFWLWPLFGVMSVAIVVLALWLYVDMVRVDVSQAKATLATLNAEIASAKAELGKYDAEILSCPRDDKNYPCVRVMSSWGAYGDTKDIYILDPKLGQ